MAFGIRIGIAAVRVRVGVGAVIELLGAEVEPFSHDDFGPEELQARATETTNFKPTSLQSLRVIAKKEEREALEIGRSLERERGERETCGCWQLLVLCLMFFGTATVRMVRTENRRRTKE